MRVHSFLVFLCGLLLGGCVNDYLFSQVDRVPADDDDVGRRAPPTPTDPPPSQWPPDTGDMPDLYFAIAWSEWPCQWGEGVWADGAEPLEQSDIWMPCDARNVAVVNMFGEVLDEFTPPGLEEAEAVGFLQLSGGGPGQFLHVVQPLDVTDSGTEADSFYLGASWQAWRGDSYTGEHLMVATWDNESQSVWLPEAGRFIDVGVQSSNLQLGLLPTNPDLLLTWSGQEWCAPSSPLQPLRMTHIFSPDTLIVGWDPEDFLPPELLGDVAIPAAWNMDLSVDEEGEVSALFGVTTGGCSGAPDDPATLQLVSWSPGQEDGWFAPTETGWQPRAATYTGGRGTGALNLLGELGLPRWRVTSPASVSEGPLSPDLSGYRPGPLIDPQGPTFTVIGTEVQTWAGDSLDFYHQGEVVWSIDRLKFGLQERQVYFADAVLLSQRP